MHKRILLGLLALATAAGLALAVGRTGQAGLSDLASGSVVLTDQTWKCTGPVNLTSVTVTINAGVSKNGVLLGSGCTGYIGRINVTQYNSDGIKVGAGAHDLVIDGGTIRCYAKADLVHQDGIQVMGGQRIVFNNMDVGCYTANNSQAMIHEGAGLQELPTDIVFNGGKFDGQRSGAYGVSIGDSLRSGYQYATICPAHLHTWYVGSGAQQPVEVGNVFPASC